MADGPSPRVSTAGRGDPYWYVWFVGSSEVIYLPDPDTDVQSVALRVPGIEGWDDVMVRPQDGRRRCYQAKQSRVENNTTFGSFVHQFDGGDGVKRSITRPALRGPEVLGVDRREETLETLRPRGTRTSGRPGTGCRSIGPCPTRGTRDAAAEVYHPDPRRTVSSIPGLRLAALNGLPEGHFGRVFEVWVAELRGTGA